ncbi:hypothetical protein GCM10027443_05680 [Pontibacter brevis]
MEELNRLIKIVTPNSVKNGLSISTNSSSKEGKFVEGLYTSAFENDNQAASFLYNASANDVRYKMLKHRLKKKLYNHLLFLGYDKGASFGVEQKEQEVMRLLFQAKVLLRKMEYGLAQNLSNKAYRLCIEYDFTDLAVSSLIISVNCLAEESSLTSYVSMYETLQLYKNKEKLTQESLELFQIAKLNLRKSVKSRKAYLQNIPEVLNQLKSNWEQSGTFSAFNAYYKLYIWYNELIGDFQGIINITTHTFELIKEEKINAKRFDKRYNYYILVYAYLRNKEYDLGLKSAAAYKSNFEPGSLNWFSYMENYFLLAFHAKHYELSKLIITEVYSNSFFAKIFSSAKERWTLYGEYLNLLSSASNNQLPKSRFLMSSLPEYSKDKQGFNVAILILQFVYFLQKEDSEALLYRIESLKKYILTHLKDAFSLRSKTFLRLLILTVTEDFNAEDCKKKGQKLYQKLIETPPPGDAYAEIEIIPYEHLWEHILSILEKKF